MSVLPLLFVLYQSLGQASNADTAFARQALLRGVPEVRSDASLAQRYFQQLETWGLREQAWPLAVQLDTAQKSGMHTSRLLLEQHQRGDVAGVRRRLSQIPQHHREPVLAALISSGVPLEGPRGLLTSTEDIRPLVRARAMAGLGMAMPPDFDSAAARTGLRNAIALLRNDTTQESRKYVVEWLFQLRRLGAPVSTGALVQRSIEQGLEADHARLQVAHMLLQARDHQAVLPLLDTVIARAERDTRRLALFLRAEALRQRGTPADSQRAALLIDSVQRQLRLETTDSAQLRQFRFGRALDSLNAILQEKRIGGVAEALDSVLMAYGDAAHVLITTAEQIFERIEPRSFHRHPPIPDSLQSFLAAAFNVLWRPTAFLATPDRDRVRLTLIGLIAPFDTARALRLARDSLVTPHFRDRGVANALAEIVYLDGERAATLVQPLVDSVARNIVYRRLAERAIMEGQLERAASFANRTAFGEPRVDALLSLGTAQFRAGQIAQARVSAQAALASLTPVWSCQGCLRITYCLACPNQVEPVGQPPIDQPPTMTPMLIVYTVRLALETGIMEELERWAANQKTGEARAAAWVAIAETMAFYKLGQFPNYPIY